MARVIDPIEEGVESDAFWMMAEGGIQALMAMEARIIPVPAHVERNRKDRYRLSYICNTCEAEHRVEGGFDQVFMGTQALMLLNSARGVRVEKLAFAMEEDANTADTLMETQGADPRLNKQLDTLLKRGPKTDGRTDT